MNQAAPPRWALGVIVTIYVLLTLALVVQVRINATPDEAAHVQYVQHLATLGELPVFEARPTVNGENPPGYEYHQPPLYYVLCVPLWKATGPGVQQYMCRVVSLVLGALTLIVLWHAVRTLFSENGPLPVLATGFAALWPLHQGVGASAGNDALTGLIAAASFFWIARGAQRSWAMKDLIVLGALCGLGLLTKTSCLVLLLLSMGAAWHFSGRDRQSGSSGLSPVLATATVLGVTLVVSGWWLLRNQSLYGDALALNIFNRAFANIGSAQLMTLVRLGGVPLPTYAQAVLFLLACTTWGIFGGPVTALEMYSPFARHGMRSEALPGLLLLGVCLIASILAGWGVLLYLRKWRAQEPATRTAILWWLAGFILVALSFISFNMHYFQVQARYFHPALVPMATGFALGWQETWCRIGKTRALWISSVVFGVVLAVVTLWNVFNWQTLV